MPGRELYYKYVNQLASGSITRKLGDMVSAVQPGPARSTSEAGLQYIVYIVQPGQLLRKPRPNWPLARIDSPRFHYLSPTPKPREC